MHSSNTSSLAAFLALILVLPALGRDCYNPDGTIPADGKSVPCGPADGPHSACCAIGDGCSTTGLCYGNAGYMYRGGCTDPNWAAPECPQHCQKVATNSFSNLYPCPNPPGLYTTNFCCGAQEGHAPPNGCCGITDFNTSASGGFGSFSIKAGSAANVSQPTSTTSTTSISIAASATSTNSVSPAPAQSSPAPSSPPPPSTRTTALGAGIGIPLGTLLLAGLAFLLYREKRNRRRLEQRLQDLQSSFDHQTSVLAFENTKNQLPGPHELHPWERQPPELHPQAMVEIAEHL